MLILLSDWIREALAPTRRGGTEPTIRSIQPNGGRSFPCRWLRNSLATMPGSGTCLLATVWAPLRMTSRFEHWRLPRD